MLQFVVPTIYRNMIKGHNPGKNMATCVFSLCFKRNTSILSNFFPSMISKIYSYDPSKASQFVSKTLPIAYTNLNFSTTRQNYLKEVNVVTEGNVTTVEGNYVESPSKDNFLQVQSQTACPLCRLDLTVHYSDVLILRQFIQADGTIVSRFVSGLCNTQQIRIKKLIRQARRAGLMPKPRNCEPQYDYEKYNVYFEDK